MDVLALNVLHLRQYDLPDGVFQTRLNNFAGELGMGEGHIATGQRRLADRFGRNHVFDELGRSLLLFFRRSEDGQAVTANADVQFFFSREESHVVRKVFAYSFFNIALGSAGGKEEQHGAISEVGLSGRMLVGGHDAFLDHFGKERENFLHFIALHIDVSIGIDNGPAKAPNQGLNIPRSIGSHIEAIDISDAVAIRILHCLRCRFDHFSEGSGNFQAQLVEHGFIIVHHRHAALERNSHANALIGVAGPEAINDIRLLFFGHVVLNRDQFASIVKLRNTMTLPH